MCMTSTITRKGHVHNYTVLSSSFTCTHHLSFSNVSPPPVSHFPFPSPFPLLLLLPFQLPIFLLPLLLLLLLPSCTPPSLTPYPTPPSHTPPSVSPLLLHPLPLLLLLIPLPLLFLLPPPFFIISPSPFHSPSSLSLLLQCLIERQSSGQVTQSGACPDMQDDVTSVSGFRDGCTTCITFTRPLNTGE